jgi:S-DNA-T family DNA segregation ATPase FtsK/SpoIIIE
MTQTGKSTLTIALVTCAYIAYGPDLDVYLIEGKPGALVRFEKLAVRYEASSKTAVFDSMVCELLQKQKERYDLDNEAMRERKPKPRHRQILFIADEVADYYVSDGSKESIKEKARLVKNSSELVRKGLECGITVVMMTQCEISSSGASASTSPVRAARRWPSDRTTSRPNPRSTPR